MKINIKKMNSTIDAAIAKVLPTLTYKQKWALVRRLLSKIHLIFFGWEE
jgi:hypothetical protein